MLIRSEDSAFLVIDVQQSFMSAIPNANQVAANIQRLLEVGQLCDVPVLCSEQYPKGLGKTIDAISVAIPIESHHEKMEFSCMANAGLREAITSLNKKQILIAGLESHVCVLQTSLELKEQGYDVFVVQDAIGSRFEVDTEVAVARMRDAGVVMVTFEMVVTEWLRTSARPEFKTISAIMKGIR